MKTCFPLKGAFSFGLAKHAWRLRCIEGYSMLVKMNYYMTFLCFFLLVSNADAHKLGESYLFLSIDNQTIEGRVEITLSDLDNAIRLDKNNDGKISQEELDSEISLVKSYVSERIKLGTDQSPYRIRLTTHEIGKYNLGKYALIYFYVEDLEEIPQVLDVDYAFLYTITGLGLDSH